MPGTPAPAVTDTPNAAPSDVSASGKAATPGTAPSSTGSASTATPAPAHPSSPAPAGQAPQPSSPAPLAPPPTDQAPPASSPAPGSAAPASPASPGATTSPSPAPAGPGSGTASASPDVSASPPSPAPATPPVKEAPVPQLLPVHFATGESRIAVDGRAILEVVASTLLNELKQNRIRLEGRSDGFELAPSGDTTEARLELSLARAVAVRDHLRALGVPASQLQVEGLGSRSPLGALETNRDKERNRSVIFVVLAPVPVGRVREVAPPPGDEEAARASQGAGHTATSSGSASPSSGAEGGPSSGSALNGDGGSLPITSSGDASSQNGPQGPTSSGPPRGTSWRETSSYRTGPQGEVLAVRMDEGIRGPVEVESLRLEVQLVRRDGPGSRGKTRWPISEFLAGYLDTFETLFREALNRNQELVGETRLAVSMDADGNVTAVRVALPVPYPPLEQKLEALARTWTLPPPPGGAEMRFELALRVFATFRVVVTPMR